MTNVQQNIQCLGKDASSHGLLLRSVHVFTGIVIVVTLIWTACSLVVADCMQQVGQKFGITSSCSQCLHAAHSCRPYCKASAVV